MGFSVKFCQKVNFLVSKTVIFSGFVVGVQQNFTKNSTIFTVKATCGLAFSKMLEIPFKTGIYNPLFTGFWHTISKILLKAPKILQHK